MLCQPMSFRAERGISRPLRGLSEPGLEGCTSPLRLRKGVRGMLYPHRRTMHPLRLASLAASLSSVFLGWHEGDGELSEPGLEGF